MLRYVSRLSPLHCPTTSPSQGHLSRRHHQLWHMARTWCPVALMVIVLGPLANSYIFGKCAFPSPKPVREQTESVGQWWRALMRPKGSMSQKPLAPLLGLPATQWCWTMSKRCSLSCFTFLDELYLTLYGILALVRYVLVPKCRYYWLSMPQLCMLYPPCREDVHPVVRFTE